MKLNDIEIIANLLTKDERLINKTLKSLYKDFKPMVSKIVLTNSGNNDDLADVLQEGVLSFYENIVLINSVTIRDFSIVNKSNDVVKVSSYMFSVFRNIWFAKLRSKKFQSNKDILHYSTDDVEEDVYEYEDLYVKKKQVYLDSFKRLDEKCKEILNLFWYKKLSFKDIAIKMSHSNHKTSKQIKSRCQKKLKEMCTQELIYDN
jgi:RNA polymerase sigma factor (sigma-70 family)